MYNVDDAVARVDSYIVSVAGAGPHVGEQRMVRIESVGRSAATAALLERTGTSCSRRQWRWRREARIRGLQRARDVAEAGAEGDGPARGSKD